MSNPYSNLPFKSFWNKGVSSSDPFSPSGLYKKKFDISNDDLIATAGSCFAQHIAKGLRKNGYRVLDVELPPEWLPLSNHAEFGYGLYSARYGNIYTVAQLVQLISEANGESSPGEYIWHKNGFYFDAFRPAVELEGFVSEYEVIVSRQFHLSKVKEMILNMDVFIFTLGLTESWVSTIDGVAFPSAPGVIANPADPDKYSFKNYQYIEIYQQFLRVMDLIAAMRGSNAKQVKYILTVSPVPLTATASGEHVLTASTYSKAVLRSVAGDLANTFEHIDYFPSYEVITNPASRYMFYDSNLRTVRPEGVNAVMKIFFSEHKPFILPKNINQININNNLEDENNSVVCEERLLEAFGK
jgi:hypothetical protein